MDQLDLAIRQYPQILPKSQDNLGPAELKQPQAWLADEICPVLEEYVRRPAFQRACELGSANADAAG